VKDFYNENYKALEKTLEGRKISHSWISRIHIVIITILLNTIYRFNIFPIKIPIPFFSEIEKKSWNLYGYTKDPQIAKAILRKRERGKKSKAEVITIHNFKFYYRAIVIKKTMILAQNRHIGQWNTIGDSETNPHRYHHLMFSKGTKTTTLEKR
jgi:hypothetical protein